MIRINLAPRVSVKLTGNISDSLVLSPDQIRSELIKRFGLILLPIVLLMLVEHFRIPELQAELAQKNSYLQELKNFNSKKQTSVDEIKKFKEDEQRIQQKIDMLESISKDRLREVKLLDLFQQIIPERLWLTTLDVKNFKVIINGFATTDADISAFVDALAKSVYVSDVILTSSSEEIIDDVALKYFDITCTLGASK